MTDYDKLVKALRLCQFGECGCGKCYYKELKGDWCTEDNHPEFFDCDDKLKLDAADAIEALQAEIRESMQRCAECGDELAHQMPKRGEWKTTRPDAPMFGFYYCSICGRKRTSPQDNYCPNCGAKMTEVRE